MSVAGMTQGKYREFSKKDTMITHLYGDSMYMAMNDSGHVKSLSVFRMLKANILLRQSVSAERGIGKVMAIAFNAHGDVDNVKVWGNARSVYHIADNKSTGCNTASGDSVFCCF